MRVRRRRTFRLPTYQLTNRLFMLVPFDPSYHPIDDAMKGYAPTEPYYQAYLPPAGFNNENVTVSHPIVMDPTEVRQTPQDNSARAHTYTLTYTGQVVNAAAAACASCSTMKVGWRNRGVEEKND